MTYSTLAELHAVAAEPGQAGRLTWAGWPLDDTLPYPTTTRPWWDRWWGGYDAEAGRLYRETLVGYVEAPVIVEGLDTEHPALTFMGPGRLTLWVRVREGAAGWSWADVAQHLADAATQAAAALWPNGTRPLLAFESAEVGIAPAPMSGNDEPAVPGGPADSVRTLVIGLGLVAALVVAAGAVWRAGGSAS